MLTCVRASVNRKVLLADLVTAALVRARPSVRPAALRGPTQLHERAAHAAHCGRTAVAMAEAYERRRNMISLLRRRRNTISPLRRRRNMISLLHLKPCDEAPNSHLKPC